MCAPSSSLVYFEVESVVLPSHFFVASNGFSNPPTRRAPTSLCDHGLLDLRVDVRTTGGYLFFWVYLGVLVTKGLVQ